MFWLYQVLYFVSRLPLDPPVDLLGKSVTKIEESGLASLTSAAALLCAKLISCVAAWKLVFNISMYLKDMWDSEKEKSRLSFVCLS